MSAFLENWPVKVLGGTCLSVWGPRSPPCYTLYDEYIPLYLFREGGRGSRWTSEKVRGALVHKMGRKYQHDWLYLQSKNSTPVKTTFGVLIDIWSMGNGGAGGGGVACEMKLTHKHFIIRHTPTPGGGRPEGEMGINDSASGTQILLDHGLNMQLDLRSLFGLLCTTVLIGWDTATPPSPRIWAHIRGCYWPAKIDDTTALCNPRTWTHTETKLLLLLISVGKFSPAMGARNQVGIGLSYRPASLCSLATQCQTWFLESIPRPIAGLKF
jgi:hypothetical protein